VRISGPQADAALKALAGKLPEPRVARLATLRADGEVLDKALVIRFPGPASVTGEDVAELHLHGGRSVVAAVQAALGRMAGLRQAEAGEFTRRAFENGRIDLAEAEGLADLLEAETESQRRAALVLAGGALSRQVANWQDQILALSARVEATLDFSDEEDVGENPLIDGDLAPLRKELANWIVRPPVERLKDGIRVVVTGPPNAGKSSLFNALVRREAAITSEIPGTTRDVIEAPVAIAGIPFVLVDTAGLRDSTDRIESIGVARALESAEMADLVLWLGAADEAPKGAIRVHPKADLGGSSDGSDVAVSVISGQGLDDLTRIMIQRSEAILPAAGDVAINARHRAALEATLVEMIEAGMAQDLLIVAESLRRARAALDRVTGRAGVEDMLDALFGRFCIGK
jgi:tRNA modification GTPase